MIVAASIVTGGAWSAVADRGWYPRVAYGLPALEAGQVWTVMVGLVFAVDPASYVPVLLSFAVFVGYAEWRLGTARAAVVTVGGQVVAVAVSALVLWLLRGVGWDWAGEMAGRRDVGPSAGALVALAVVSAAVRPPWRLRLRLGLGIYAVVCLLYIGHLADVEHFLAVALALPLSTRLAPTR